jgi:hypothetical protein
MRSRTLVDFLTYTTGAHVLMLDVTGDAEADQAAQWPQESHAAMLRYTWLKDSMAPPQARLLASLPEAMEKSGQLAQLDANMERIHVSLASAYPPQSTSYRRRVPPALEALLFGESLPVQP